MALIKKLFSKEKNRFYELLLRQTAKTLEGLGALAGYLDECGLNCVRLVKKFETEADDLRVRLIEELDKTFVTPIDREDIFDLSRAIDDVMDYANSTVLEMEAFEVIRPKGQEAQQCLDRCTCNRMQSPRFSRRP